jgi:hypothetical protein
MERIPYGYYRGSLSPATEDTSILSGRLFVTLLELNMTRMMSSFLQLAYQYGTPPGPRSNASIGLIFMVVTLDGSKVTLAIRLQLRGQVGHSKCPHTRRKPERRTSKWRK